jgi:hypothetical protein
MHQHSCVRTHDQRNSRACRVREVCDTHSIADCRLGGCRNRVTHSKMRRDVHDTANDRYEIFNKLDGFNIAGPANPIYNYTQKYSH